MNKKITFLLFFALPILIFFFLTIFSERSDTMFHERVHAKICERYYYGTPKVEIDLFGNGKTFCLNATDIDNPIGRQFDTQNEITGYNLNGIRNSITFMSMLFILLMGMMGIIVSKEHE